MSHRERATKRPTLAQASYSGFYASTTNLVRTSPSGSARVTVVGCDVRARLTSEGSPRVLQAAVSFRRTYWLRLMPSSEARIASSRCRLSPTRTLNLPE